MVDVGTALQVLPADFYGSVWGRVAFTLAHIAKALDEARRRRRGCIKNIRISV